VAEYRTTEGDQIVEILASWPVRMMLLIIFLSCINVILHAPGHGVAEVVGLVALLLMLGVPMLTGYAQWWEILLIFIGLGLVALEIVLPGHLVPGFTGAGLVLFGLVMTFVPKEPSGMPGFLPSTGMAWTGLQTGLMVVVGGMACAMVIWIIMNRFLPKTPFFNRLILTATSGGTVGGVAMHGTAHVWPPIGSIGRAVSELKPGGTAEFFDDSIGARRTAAVVSDSGFVDPGSAIIVQEVAGSRIVVRKAATPAAASSSA
jgi:membrane-bound serine protease (ClpP class)